MKIYLFFPLPDDVALAATWNSSDDAEARIQMITADIQSYTDLLALPAFTSFCAHQFADGLPLYIPEIHWSMALNHGPSPAQTNLFMDSLDLTVPDSTGASGYGYYGVEILQETFKIRYSAQNVNIVCSIQDDAGHVEPLGCTMAIHQFCEGVKVLAGRTLAA